MQNRIFKYECYIRDSLRPFFAEETPIFKQVMALKGECYRQQKGRHTLRVKIGDQFFFLKQHHGVGVKEILKNLLQLKMPVLGAKNEWLAIQKCQELGIAVASIAAYGSHGLHPARMKSFILMEDLVGTISLEHYCAPWKNRKPSFTVKLNLIKKVAEIARIMHEGGINHRDFYLCHFLLAQNENDKEPLLYLIDLHRAAIREITPIRLKLKDLAGLYFSSLDIGLTTRDYFRFIKFYTRKSMHDNLKNIVFWEKVRHRGTKLYRDLKS